MEPPDRTTARVVAWRGRATRAEIDLDALAGNVAAIRTVLPADTGVMAVVKANAYGHGAVEIARAAVEAGAVGLAVATVGEGQSLRRAGIVAPALVLGAIDPTEAEAALRSLLAVTVGTEELLDAVQAAARRIGLARPVLVHVKVDTGLRRYGALPDLALALARRVDADARLDLDGVFTHFATADEDDDSFVDDQRRLLSQCLARLAEAGIRPRHSHQANSAGALRGVAAGTSLARVGIALYGASPSPAVPLAAGIRPVMTLRSRIARVFDLAPGDTVGYGRTYRSTTTERAALVPLGYGDGYRRVLSGRGWMGIGGRRAAAIGRVSMDQTVVRLAAGVGAAVGDEVTVMGGSSDEAGPAADELAALCDTIPYELFTGIAVRVPRLFLRGGEVVSFDDGAGPSDRPELDSESGGYGIRLETLPWRRGPLPQPLLLGDPEREGGEHDGRRSPADQPSPRGTRATPSKPTRRRRA